MGDFNKNGISKAYFYCLKDSERLYYDIGVATEKNEKGKYKRKKRFGRSLAKKAPSMLLTIIDRKLKYFGEELIEINTYEAKASQLNHFDETYTKKSLS